MKNLKKLTSIISMAVLSSFFLLSSCNKEDENQEPTDESQESICITQVNDNLPDIETSGISYPTTPALEVPSNIQWTVPVLAKEITNNNNYITYLAAGPQAMPDNVWDAYEFDAPWSKNLDRFLQIDSTTFLRSPSAPSNCQGISCYTPLLYLGYSWIELAQTVSGDYVPCLSNEIDLDPREVPEGHFEFLTIKKCQILQFTDEIYQLSDNQGNYYVMHATENGTPTTSVSLPEGWTLELVSLNEALIITPFGNEGDCYFNILVDHLGQGYHQYIYADDVYPGN